MAQATRDYNYGFEVRNKDIIRNGNGGYNFIDGSEKLKRDIVKAMVTDIQGNGFGTSLNQLPSQKLTGRSIKSIVKRSIEGSLDFLRQQQQNIENMQESEQIKNADVYVYRDPDRPTNINFNIDVQTENDEVVEVPTLTQRIS